MKTIKNIAELAKVSIGTVDRVLHNRGGVAKKTEIRVRAIIDQYGFTPNVVARNLVLKKEFKIAVLIPKFDSRSPFWGSPKVGIHKALKEVSNFGFTANLFYFDQFDIKSYKDSLNEILGITYDGLILAPLFAKETLKRKKSIDKLNIPYVFVNADLNGLDNLSFIGQNSYKSGYLSGKLFYLNLPEDSSILIVKFLEDLENHHSLDDRIKGITDFFKDKNASIIIDELKIKKFSTDQLNKQLTKKLISNNKIKGIFSPSNRISAVAEYLYEFEIEMKTVIGYDITENTSKYLNRDIITFIIGQEPHNQGYKSVKILFDYIVNKVIPEKKYFSPIQIVTKENLDSYK